MVEAEGKTFEFVGEEAITPEALETFPYEHPDLDALVELDSDEWNCVCPFSGLPDFGAVTIRYIPSDRCIELKSLKYYLTSFRQVGIYQEHAAGRLLKDLSGCCDPKWMEVVLEYRVRGGIHTVVTVETGSDGPVPV